MIGLYLLNSQHRSVPLSADEAVKQITAVLQTVGVPGPYFLRSYSSSGQGPSNIKIVRVLDGGKEISTGEYLKGDHNISLVFRGSNPNPTLKFGPFMSQNKPPQKGVINPELTAKVSRWADRLRGSDAIKLEHFESSDSRLATASFVFLKGGFKPLDQQYRMTFTVSIPSGEFREFTQNRSPASKLLGAIRIKSAEEATKAFQKIHSTGLDVPNGGPLSTMSPTGLKGAEKPVTLNPSEVILMGTPQEAYMAGPNASEYKVVWAFKFRLRSGANQNQYSVVLDASNGELVGSVMPS